MRSGVSRASVRFLRRWRMISCPAAKQIRWVKPSMTTVSPSWTWAAMASCMERTCEAWSVIGRRYAVNATPPMTDNRRLSFQLFQALIEDGEGGVHIVVVHDERRRQPQRALAGAEQEEPLGERQPLELADQIGVGRARGAVGDELDPDHEAAAAHFADRPMLVGEMPHAGQEALPLDAGVPHELALDQVEGDERGGAGDGIAAEGRSVGARPPLHHRGPGDQRADRHPGAQALGDGYHVGLEAFVLAREHLPGARSEE